MVRTFVFLAAAQLVLAILALISSLSADRVRAMPKILWVLVILLLPLIGPVAYFAFGRPVRTSAPRRPARPSSPDDDPDFLRSVDTERSRRERETLARWEAELRRREQEHNDDERA